LVTQHGHNETLAARFDDADSEALIRVMGVKRYKCTINTANKRLLQRALTVRRSARAERRELNAALERATREARR
jgi:hypothetical protein